MNVPLPAAVNESVKLTKALGKASAAGMVNAVRAAARRFRQSLREQICRPGTDWQRTTACPAR